MEFAIVDIETTGGHATGNCITEVSIHIHNGSKVIKRYDTLINPGTSIPYYITGLTGINNKMVAKAPSFNQIAQEIYSLLKDRIFVAHSVNFDYSFIKRELATCGIELNCKKLCTIRLSRKIFPGFKSYSLGNLCGELGIPIKNRHRAGGDAEATVILFEHLIAKDNSGVIQKFLKKGSKEQALPPNLPKEQFENLPNNPGVYYFHNQKGKVLYVGKAKDIKKRVSSHFSNNSPHKQKQDFLRNIFSVSHQVCGSELMALILESHEIKRLWPEFNRSQKRFEHLFGIIEYTDQRGFKRLAVEKARRNMRPIITFGNLAEGYARLRKCIAEFDLCPRLSGLATDTGECETKNCVCISKKKNLEHSYNEKVDTALENLKTTDSFLIMEKGRTDNELGCVLVESGNFKRMGYLPVSEVKEEECPNEMLESLPFYKENFNIRQIIYSYRNDNPQKVKLLTQQVSP